MDANGPPAGVLPMRPCLVALFVAILVPLDVSALSPDTYDVGVAQVDITPAYPIRLSGFGFRRTESEGVTQRIWAKALVIDDGTPLALVTVDNLGIPAHIVDEIATRLRKTTTLPRDRLAITATHTHTAPMLTGVAPTLFGTSIPKAHQERIDRYTSELTDKLEKVVLAALADRKPARLRWGIGRVGFASNRRTAGGPVDQDLPILVARDLKGTIRAIYVSYACHCVTLSHNKISGDWAGFAQEQIRDEFPGSIALVSVGCGADSNPSSGVTGDKVEIVSRQGGEIAREVKRLVNGYLTPITGKITSSVRRFKLPLADPPTREQWQAKAERKDAIGYHARVNLARLERKESLPSHVNYSVQCWQFGDALAMAFLPGEVVVDYSLRLKKELDGLRLWINAYANDAPCYIPSERILKEGGYEGGGAMVYYDLPGPFRPGLEQKIIEATHQQLDERFRSPFDASKTGGTRPQSPQQSQQSLRTKPAFAVELVAAEPLVTSPVAIDWGPDGRLWVAEMVDYPSGTKGDFKPGGRIKVLEDQDGDGRFDRATVFLDNIPFPTGVTVWRNGVLVCAAPDILYAEDRDGDSKADVVKKLFSGFGTDNYQARVNSLEYGLDGWVYGSCGLFGGKIQSHKLAKPIDLGDRDFRIRPDTGELEPATGRTQQGRVRNDWGDWFGCDNSTLCWHYPLPDHYLRRNPYVAPPPAGVVVTDYPGWNRLYPVRQQLQLFRLSGPANNVTAACGLGIYRDELLGEKYSGDAFVCEPVNLVVHHMKLSHRGSTFSARRAGEEATSEFLASTDNWFRPVQVRTGPDGALWVVDMYRFVIEHPRWIPPEELAKVDVRAGSSMGRIYRVQPKDRAWRPTRHLDKLDKLGLVAALDSANGWQRDLAGQMLVWKQDLDTVSALSKLATSCPRAETRLEALCVLAGLHHLPQDLVRQALKDRHAGVRRHAVRLAESFVKGDTSLGTDLLPLVRDPDAQVRLQVAFALGSWNDPRSGEALATLLHTYADDPYLVAGALSSINAHNLSPVVTTILSSRRDQPVPQNIVHPLFATAVAIGDAEILSSIARAITTPQKGRYDLWQMAALASLLDAAGRRGRSFEQLSDEATRSQIGRMLRHARQTSADDGAPVAERLAALPLLGRDPGQREADLKLLDELLNPRNPTQLQAAALTVLGGIVHDRSPELLASHWNSYSPALKGQALDVLLSRPAWQRRLLDLIEANSIPAAELDAARRQRLLTHREEPVRSRAAKLFDGAVNADRRKVLDNYQAAAKLRGDVERGRKVFAKRCSVCHQLDGVGHAVGPDLRALTNKSPLYLLTEILDPNRNVDSRYLAYSATTRSGRTYTGILSSESATSITLRGEEGKEHVLLRADLEELSSTGKSLMPEGLEKELSLTDAADLVALLVRSP
jgi:putative membrane-bound dehydrogenase-like protein